MYWKSEEDRDQLEREQENAEGEGKGRAHLRSRQVLMNDVPGATRDPTGWLT